MEQYEETGEIYSNYSTPYLTIVPEIQAEYLDGQETLINYLKKNSKSAIKTVTKNKLNAGKLYFTVNKTGTISKVDLTASSGYPEIDELMIELIINAPGQWKPAKNTNGENVDQKLVFSFGIMGC